MNVWFCAGARSSPRRCLSSGLVLCVLQVLGFEAVTQGDNLFRDLAVARIVGLPSEMTQDEH